MGTQLIRTVWATVARAGYHYWPQAPEHRAYLRSRHRHLFQIRAEVVVHHDDRDVEFHDLQAFISDWWGQDEPKYLGASSCEAIALTLVQALHAAGFTTASVTVSEDGENGSTITVTEA